MAGTVETNACLETKSLNCNRCAFEWFEIEINSWLNKGKASLSFPYCGNIILSFLYTGEDERLAAQAKELASPCKLSVLLSSFENQHKINTRVSGEGS